MTASIFWRPVNNDGHDVPTNCPSRTIECLEELGTVLNLEHLPALRALKKMNDGNSGAWDALIEGIEKYGIIEWYARW